MIADLLGLPWKWRASKTFGTGGPTGWLAARGESNDPVPTRCRKGRGFRCILNCHACRTSIVPLSMRAFLCHLPASHPVCFLPPISDAPFVTIPSAVHRCDAQQRIHHIGLTVLRSPVIPSVIYPPARALTLLDNTARKRSAQPLD